MNFFIIFTTLVASVKAMVLWCFYTYVLCNAGNVNQLPKELLVAEDSLIISGPVEQLSEMLWADGEKIETELKASMELIGEDELEAILSATVVNWKTFLFHSLGPLAEVMLAVTSGFCTLKNPATITSVVRTAWRRLWTSLSCFSKRTVQRQPRHLAKWRNLARSEACNCWGRWLETLLETCGCRVCGRLANCIAAYTGGDGVAAAALETQGGGRWPCGGTGVCIHSGQQAQSRP
eukprot:3999567-Amphidinium_carterae.3